MANPILEATNTFPIIPVIVSMVATLILFVLARLAIYLYRSGEVEVTAKRIIDLNPRAVKLSLRVENRERKERELYGLCLVKKEKKGYVLLANPEQEPLLREGFGSFIVSDERGHGFCCRPNEVGEIVVEFALPAAVRQAYLGGYDKKGRFLVAPLSLIDSSTQLLSFHKGNYIK